MVLVQQLTLRAHMQDQVAHALHSAWQAWHLSAAACAHSPLWALPAAAAAVVHESSAIVVEQPMRTMQLRAAARSLARCCHCSWSALWTLHTLCVLCLARAAVPGPLSQSLTGSLASNVTPTSCSPRAWRASLFAACRAKVLLWDT